MFLKAGDIRVLLSHMVWCTDTRYTDNTSVNDSYLECRIFLVVSSHLIYENRYKKLIRKKNKLPRDKVPIHPLSSGGDFFPVSQTKSVSA
jgi:hypothetical protein